MIIVSVLHTLSHAISWGRRRMEWSTCLVKRSRFEHFSILILHLYQTITSTSFRAYIFTFIPYIKFCAQIYLILYHIYLCLMPHYSLTYILFWLIKKVTAPSFWAYLLKSKMRFWHFAWNSSHPPYLFFQS